VNKLLLQTISIRVTGLLLSLCTSVLLARLLGPFQLGQYAFIVTMIEILSIIALFGTPALIIREISAGMTKSAFGKVRGIMTWTTKITTLLSIPLIIITALLFLQWNANNGGTLSPTILIIAAGLILIEALSRQQTTTIQGLGKIVSSQVVSIIVASTLFLTFLMILMVLFPKDLSITKIFLLLAISRIIALVMMRWEKKRALPSEVFQNKPEFYPNQWIKSALPLLLVGSMYIINTRIDIIMLGYLRDSADVGLYRVAQRGGQLMLFGVMAVDSVINPLAAKAWAQQQQKKLQQVLNKSTLMVLIFTLPLFVLYIVFGQNLINFIFGIEFKEAWLPLVILSCGYLSFVLFGRDGIILSMSNFEQFSAITITVGGVLNIILNLLLIPKYGIYGAAFATALALCFRMVMEALFAYFKTGVNTTIFSLLMNKNQV
jgi:O-antigen/teichoic acid export membrane protein